MSSPLLELARLFGVLGTVAFGGPAAHIALIQKEVVERRQWLTGEEFLDMMGAVNLIPGPNSTEIVLLVGLRRAGWAGLLVAGTAFILPAALITTFFAWVYREWGTLPQLAPVLAGMQPVVVVLIAHAGWRLGKKAVKSAWLLAVGLVTAGLSVLGVGELPALLIGGLLGILGRRRSAGVLAWWPPLPLMTTAPPAPAPGLWSLALFFLKVGAVLFGGGYLLIAFIERDLVERYGWLTQQQLLDAIAVGQFTPGPVLSTASFVGFLIADWPGALVATVAIFLPSFGFVALLNPLISWLRRNTWTGAFLDGLNVAAVALIGVVAVRLGWRLGTAAWGTSWGYGLWVMGIALVAAVLMGWQKVPAPWLVGLGAVVAGAVSYRVGMIPELQGQIQG